jgi:hypothetical protein
MDLRTFVACACVVLVVCSILVWLLCSFSDESDGQELFTSSVPNHNKPAASTTQASDASPSTSTNTTNVDLQVPKAVARFRNVAEKLRSFDIDQMRTNLQKQTRMISDATATHQHIQKSSVRMKRASRLLEKLRLSRDPMPTDNAEEVTTVLWSGGVASTYRICDLVLVQKRIVRPVFLNAVHLDDRNSIQQERRTVRDLYSYLHEQHTDGTRDRLLHVQTITCDETAASGGMNVVSLTPENQLLRKQIQHAFGMSHPSQVTVFDMALAQLPAKCGVYDTFLSAAAPFEFLLTCDTSHQHHLQAIRKWGVRATGAGRSVVAPISPPLFCTYTAAPDHSTNIMNPQNTYAQLYSHVRFVVPCTFKELGARPSGVVPLGEQMLKRAHQHHFHEVLHRTWSCRRPVATKREVRANAILVSHVPKLTRTRAMANLGQKLGVLQMGSYAHTKGASPHSLSSTPTANSSSERHHEDKHTFDSDLPRRLAWNPCYSCRACMRRHADGIWRTDAVDKDMRERDAARQRQAPGYNMLRFVSRLSPNVTGTGTGTETETETVDTDEDSIDGGSIDGSEAD